MPFDIFLIEHLVRKVNVAEVIEIYCRHCWKTHVRIRDCSDDLYHLKNLFVGSPHFFDISTRILILVTSATFLVDSCNSRRRKNPSYVRQSCQITMFVWRCLCIFYFDFKNPLQQAVVNILYSFLVQVSSSTIPTEVRRLYERCNNAAQEASVT